jgi:hypothetical protein
MHVFTLLVEFLICSLILKHYDFVDVFVLSHIGFLLIDHLHSLLEFELCVLMSQLFLT